MDRAGSECGQLSWCAYVNLGRLFIYSFIHYSYLQSKSKNNGLHESRGELKLDNAYLACNI